MGVSGGVNTSGVRPPLKDLLQTTVLGSVVECLVSNSSNTSGSTVGSTLNFISPLLGSGGFYLYFGFFSTSPQDWVLDHHKVPLTTPNSYTTLQRSTDNFFLSCTVYIYVCGRKKYLNRTLEIDSPFQTFAVGLLVEFID